MPTDNHDLGKDAVGNTQPSTEHREQSPGYETTDVNVGGVLIFLAGLAGFLLVFFVFCFVLGKVINRAFVKEDGPPTKWTAATTSKSANPNGNKRENLASNAEMQQRELRQVTSNFPTPRLLMDDGDQDVADLHAREDLLLEHYSTNPAESGTIRIPIERAMELIAQRGLPVAQGNGVAAPAMIGDAFDQVTAPLTSGFARTGYELDVMETREQRLNYGKAEAAGKTEQR